MVCLEGFELLEFVNFCDVVCVMMVCVVEMCVCYVVECEYGYCGLGG